MTITYTATAKDLAARIRANAERNVLPTQKKSFKPNFKAYARERGHAWLVTLPELDASTEVEAKAEVEIAALELAADLLDVDHDEITVSVFWVEPTI